MQKKHTVEEECLLRAVECEEAGDVLSALRMYYEMLQLESSAIEAHLGVGRCALVLEQAERAYEHFSFVLIHQHERAEAFWGRACALLWLGREEAGYKDLMRALRYDEPATSLRIDCAAQLNAWGYCKEALLALEDVNEEDRDADYALERAFAQISLGLELDVDLMNLQKVFGSEPMLELILVASRLEEGVEFGAIREKVEQLIEDEPELASRSQVLLKRFSIGF